MLNRKYTNCIRRIAGAIACMSIGIQVNTNGLNKVQLDYINRKVGELL